MPEEQLKNKFKENEDNAILGICKILANYECNICEHIADLVSYSCNVKKERMFSDDRSWDSAQARGLFFYAYKYITNNTYDQISRMTNDVYGRKFTRECIRTSVIKMSELIEKQTIWNKRWSMLKAIIKSQMEYTKEPQVEITIKVPKNVIATIKQE